MIGKESRDEQQITVEQNWLYGLKPIVRAGFAIYGCTGQVGRLLKCRVCTWMQTLVIFHQLYLTGLLLKIITLLRHPVANDIKSFTGWQQVAAYETEFNSKFTFQK
jgi:hypothetical protein